LHTSTTIIMIKLTLSLLLASSALAQNTIEDQFADKGDGSYVHNPLWDLTPFQKYQLKKGLLKIEGLVDAPAQAAAPVAVQAAAAPAPLPAAEPIRRRVKVQRPAAAAAGQHRVFSNFAPGAQRQAAAAPSVFRPAAAAAPARQQAAFQAVPQRQAAPVQQPQPTFRAAPVAAAPAAPLNPGTIAAVTGHPDPNFSRRFWQYTADTYAAKAEGSSYTYSAIF